MGTRFYSLLAAGAVVAISAASFADIIELTDGRKITGSISYQGDNVTLKGTDGVVTNVKRAQIKGVTLTNDLTPTERAAAEWTRITVQIKNADDIASVIKMHQDFLAKYPDVALAKDVTASMGVYQKLAENDPVKFRGRWMPRAQVEVTMKKWTDEARPALDLYRAGRLKETLDSVKTILLADDQNPDAMTIGGLAAFRTNVLLQAKTYFTTLAATDPSSVLAENDLGVICYQQKAQAEGIIHYTKALQIMPDNRLLLDNIAEALNAYTGDKNVAVYKALVRQFDQAEAREETELAKKGLHRWGSSWVTQQQLEQLTQRQKTLQDQFAQLEVQYKTAQQQYNGIDQQIQQAQANVDNAVLNVSIYNSQIITAQERLQDTNVLIATRDLAAAEANRAAQQVSALQQQKATLEATMNAATLQGKQVQAEMGSGTQGQFTGVQRMMEIGEGDNPPPPAPVSVNGDVPAPLPPIIITPPQVQGNTPVVVPVPVPTQIIVVPGGGGGGNNNGGGNNGGGNRGNNNVPAPPVVNQPPVVQPPVRPNSLPVPNYQPQPVPNYQPQPVPNSQ